jgi:DNA-binding NarL/FixJ family response regulator
MLRGERRRHTNRIGPLRGRVTATEERVAELAASGMTNRDVAAALFISSKTVEVNLSRIHRKLNIRSRTELYQSLRARNQNRI